MSSHMTHTFARYLRLGIIPRTVRGNWKGGLLMYSFYHDDVQYTIDDDGDYEYDKNIDYIMQCLEARDLIIERNHGVVREIYEYLKKELSTDIWVRVGAGRQLNCTFGDSNGEIAHFLMDFIDPSQFDEAVERLRSFMADNEREFCPITNFVLMVIDKDNLSLFDAYENDKVDVLSLDN